MQAQLAANGHDHRRRAGALAPSLLAGLLADSTGERMTPSHAVKNGRRYRYYISRALITESGVGHARGWRLPAHDVENAVIRIFSAAFAEPAPLIERLGLRDASAEHTRLVIDQAARIATELSQGSPAQRAELVRDLVEEVVIGETAISITVRTPLLGVETKEAPQETKSGTMVLSAPVEFRRRGVETKLVLPARVRLDEPARLDPALLKAVARGRLWFEELAAGRVASMQAIADREGMTQRYVSRLLPLAFLAPQIVEAILQGRQPTDLSAARLTNQIDLPLDWAEQRELLGS